VEQPSRSVVIIGAGFSGTVVAANLLQLSRGALRVVLIDRERIGRGVAYAHRGYPYLLNVPAGRMSAHSANPMEFVAYARRRIPTVTDEDFLPRALYGEYLETVLRNAEIEARCRVSLERIKGEACEAERSCADNPFRVRLIDGREFLADEIVLALGNPPPRPLPSADPLRGTPAYIQDPWGSPTAFHRGETVLMIGTGLTMADVVMAAVRSARGGIRIHAISRHGLVPLSQAAFPRTHRDTDGRTLVQAASFSARQLLRAVRDLAESIERQGGDWRDAITLTRLHATELWQRLPLHERRRFLRHVRPYWDIHRHRLPQETHSELTRLRLSGMLRIHAGRIDHVERVAGRLRVRWHPRGTDEPNELLVDRLINCTGPDYDPSRSRDPLLRSLLSHGLATRDPLGLGLQTGPLGALTNAQGRTARGLYYIGPMLRPQHWESTAVQELRGHAERLARHLATPPLQRHAHRHPSSAGWATGSHGGSVAARLAIG
jgi:uncharacterized NAD(P)/FAD-binding protein YdhS